MKIKKIIFLVVMSTKSYFNYGEEDQSGKLARKVKESPFMVIGKDKIFLLFGIKCICVHKMLRNSIEIELEKLKALTLNAIQCT